MPRTPADATASEPESDQRTRCPWVDLTKPDYIAYHDTEWGVPVRDDRVLFEFLTLEAAQAGLSWYTVLRKRENYRNAFADFDPAKVARFTPAKLEQLLTNHGLIRHRLKLTAAIVNAQRFLEVQKQFGSFADYIWQFVDHQPVHNAPRTLADYVSRSETSDAISKDLKRRGFKFVGTTIIYAHMQAMGMVNDHSVDCFRRSEIMALSHSR